MITLSFEIISVKRYRLTISERLSLHFARNTFAISVKRNSITTCLPYRIQSYGCAVFRGQIYYGLFVFKFLRIGAIGLCPAEEGVARAAEFIFYQSLRCPIFERLRQHIARSSVGIEHYRIAIWTPFSRERNFYGCSCAVAKIGLAEQFCKSICDYIIPVLPTHERIARTLRLSKLCRYSLGSKLISVIVKTQITEAYFLTAIFNGIGYSLPLRRQSYRF